MTLLNRGFPKARRSAEYKQGADAHADRALPNARILV